MSAYPLRSLALPLKKVRRPNGRSELTRPSNRFSVGRVTVLTVGFSTAITFLRIDSPSLNLTNTSAPGSSRGRTLVEGSQSLYRVVIRQSPGWSRSQRK